MDNEIIKYGSDKLPLSIKEVKDDPLSKIVANTFKSIERNSTNKYYTDVKNGFVYVKATYMDSEFRKHFPISTIEIIGEPIVLGNYWVIYNVLVTAFIGEHKISRPGTGGSRIQIPSDLGKALKKGLPNWTVEVDKVQYTKPTNVTPVDYIDAGNDFKSALTKAIANAQSKFGISADIYKKIILSEQEYEDVKRNIGKIFEEYITDPMDKIRRKNAFVEKLKSPQDALVFLNELIEEFNVPIPENHEFENNNPEE